MKCDNEIFLVDGSSFLFRAYHAMGRSPLSTSDGRSTQAIFGMINMIRSLIKECDPTHLAIVMDAKGKNFRHELYPEYKANRPPMPEDLREQLHYILQIIPAMGLPLISIEGVEADDVIGTLAKKASQDNYETIIISGDKDIAQLVNDKVVMIDTMKNVRYDTQGVINKFGLAPNNIIDYLALVGDSSDNIPGVPKVGPKTAVKWLQEYGDIKGIIENAEKIAGKVGENLRASIEQLHLSQKLATIECHVELDLSLADLKRKEPEITLLTEYYKDLEFNSWLRELTQSASGPKSNSGSILGSNSGSNPSSAAQKDEFKDELTTNYEIILNQEQLNDWLEKLNQAPRFAFDTETTSLYAHTAELVGVSFCIEPGHAAYLPLQHRYAGAPEQLPFEATLDKIKPILENQKIGKIMQNAKYDIEVLQNYDVKIAGLEHDTMLMAYMLTAGQSRHDMDTLAQKYLNKQTVKYSDIAGTGAKQLRFDEIDIQIAGHYAAEDADITYQLYQAILPKLHAEEKIYSVYNEIEMPLIMALVRTETRGVKVDKDILKQQSKELSQELKKIEEKAFQAAGEQFNIGSPKQIQHILYDKLELPVLKKTPKGQPSTAENVLQELAMDYELPSIILQYRSFAKLKSTYTDKLPTLINPKSGRIHTSYHQAVTATGRLSSSDPNLQNIPIRTEQGRRIREAFIAQNEYQLLAADYSQIELRIMAHLSKDKGLIYAFEHDIDVHRATAAEVFGGQADDVSDENRRRAKAINFGLIYGMSAYGLAAQLNIEQKEAKEYIDIYFERYPGVLNYMQETKQKAHQQGYVETLFGRRLNLPEINSKNGNLRQYAERTAINAPMQGTAADLIKLAMIEVDHWIQTEKCDASIILQVHDELVLEVHKDALDEVQTQITKLMSNVAPLRVPLVVDTGIGDNWKQAH